MRPLKELREICGLTQQQLAARAGIGLRLLQKYESGERNLDGAKLHTLLKLRQALGCYLSDLVTDLGTAALMNEYEEILILENEITNTRRNEK